MHADRFDDVPAIATLISVAITIGCALMGQSAHATGPARPTPVACDQYAGVIDSRPIAADLYRELEARTRADPRGLRSQAPVNGGRYWIRADYGDGRSSVPYPHIGCFADMRIGLAWFCSADTGFARLRGGCLPSSRGRPIDLPMAGCVSLPIVLREPVIFCAAGHSPVVESVELP